MKTSDPSPDEAPLGKALREWTVTTPLPQGFQEQVWRRIAGTQTSDQASPWTRWWDWMAATLARPAPATAYVLVLLLAGSVAGYWHGRQESAQLDQTLRLRYVQSVAPLRDFSP